MIVWITHVKVGHRQTPHSKALMLTHQGFNHFSAKQAANSKAAACKSRRPVNSKSVSQIVQAAKNLYLSLSYRTQISAFICSYAFAVTRLNPSKHQQSSSAACKQLQAACIPLIKCCSLQGFMIQISDRTVTVIQSD